MSYSFAQEMFGGNEPKSDTTLVTFPVYFFSFGLSKQVAYRGQRCEADSMSLTWHMLVSCYSIYLHSVYSSKLKAWFDLRPFTKHKPINYIGYNAEHIPTVIRHIL